MYIVHCMRVLINQGRFPRCNCLIATVMTADAAAAATGGGGGGGGGGDGGGEVMLCSKWCCSVLLPHPATAPCNSTRQQQHPA